MASLVDNKILFLNSSSPTRYSSSPAEEVETQLAQAQKIDHLDPAIEFVISANSGAFFESFSRRIELIKSRSQAFQDCHVTVFDKVLLGLTDNGNQIANAAAITYFCEQFLGLPTTALGAHDPRMLSNALGASTASTPAFSPQATQRWSVSTGHDSSMSPLKQAQSVAPLVVDQTQEWAPLAAEVDNNMLRLLGLYQRAKEDFFMVTNANSLQKRTAAEFLRDTAENILHYISGKEVDPRLMHELKGTFEVAKGTVAALRGGKKRKFDQPEGQMHRTRPQQCALVKRVRSPILGEKVSSEWTANQYQSQGYRDGRTLVARSGRDKIQDETTEDGRKPKRKKKQPGRGHTGIPFGYSREVDSYQPGRG